MATETCRHCGYGIPSDSSICPGCSRRHCPTEAAFAELTTAPLRHSPLLRAARRARRTIFFVGWLAIAFGLASAAHVALQLDRVAAEVSDDVPGRVTDAAEGLVMVTLAAAVLVLGTVALWARRMRRNLRGFGLAHEAWSAWSLGGWLLPGRAARERKRAVDARWRDTSPAVSSLYRAGDTRQPVSRVVVRWWALWVWMPAIAVPVAVVVAPAFERGDVVARELGVAGVAAAALLVAVLRSFYDVIGIVTVAHAHRIADGDRGHPARRWVDARLDQEPDEPQEPEQPPRPDEPVTATSTAGPPD